jgi:PEP-CTERM motif
MSTSYSSLSALASVFQSVNPCNPEEGTGRVLGVDYTAQLWLALGRDEPESSLSPYMGIGGKQNLSATGELFAGRWVPVDGAQAGEFATVQIRVWQNLDGTIETWEDALHSSTAAYGKSDLVGNYELGGYVGGLYVGGKSIYIGMSPITISAVCPEPSSYLLFGLAAGGWWWFRMRRNSGRESGREHGAVE